MKAKERCAGGGRVPIAALLLLSSFFLYAATPSSQSSESFSSGAVLKLSDRIKEVNVPGHTKTHQRVLVRTFLDTSGGPHCLAQLAFNCKSAVGITSTSITTSVPSWDKFYTAGMEVGLPGPARPGDVWVNHEFYDKPHDTSLGVKQLIYELGDVPLQGLHKTSKHFGHTLYTRDFLRAPRRALVRPFVKPDQWTDVPAKPEDVASHKTNLVLVDDELGPVLSMLQRLSGRYPDLEVVEMRFFTKAQMIDLFRRAKVYVDANMRGAERVGQECMLYYVIPILEANRNGKNEYDYPLPTERLKYNNDRNEKGEVQGRWDDMLAKVDAVLADWDGAVRSMEAARRTVYAHAQLNALDLARLLQSTLNVHVMACAEGDKQAQSAVLVGTAIHFLAPLASTTWHVPGEASRLDGQAHAALVAADDTAGALSYTSTVGQSALCRQDASQSAVAEALLEAKFGHSDVAGVLSYRALPLSPAGLHAWQEHLRHGKASVSELVIDGLVLGLLFKVDSGQPAWRPVMNENGVLAVQGTVPGGKATWDPASKGLAHWVDLRRASSVPVSLGVELDEAILDQVALMRDASINVADPAVGLPGHANVLRAYSSPTKASAYLCGHIDFRRIAGHTPYLHELCEDAVLMV